MARVNIVRESTLLRWRRKFRSFCSIEDYSEWITASDLVRVLNSAAELGPDREYVLREPV